ncbi:patatin-like phospholipase family protein [soil metagenome]
MNGRKTINLALQGGGAHGALTWGVLDKLLETQLFTFDGISGTSAGGMNAIILAQGLIDGGDEGARKALHDFWHAVSVSGEQFKMATPLMPVDLLFFHYLQAPVASVFLRNMTHLFSPYQFNPLNFHPAGEILNKLIDIEKIKQHSQLKLFICATNVQTGKIRIFHNNELSINVLLASACLPKLFQAVKVENDYYWDGGYLGNPPIFPLIYDTKSPDIVILHVVPIARPTIPKTIDEIDMRLREISFNSSLMREMRAIAFVSGLIENEWIKPEYEEKLKKINLHCVRADEAMLDFSLESVFDSNWEFLLKLRDLGRNAAEVWLEKNYDSIGKKTSVDFNEWL